ncbi:MAG TPA: hypothetical protein VIL85_26410 [Thermomicrobiales bacterium]|jgi:hypothetical protein
MIVGEVAMRDNAAWKREQARVDAIGRPSAPVEVPALEREVVALRAEVALLRAERDCGAGPRLRATPCGNGQPTPCFACQLAHAQFTIEDLRRRA